MKDISKTKKNSKRILKAVLKVFLILLVIYNFISILELDIFLKKTGYDMIIVEEYQAQKKLKENTLIISKTKNNKYEINDLVVIKISDSQYIHRIVNVDETGKFITKGDDNYRVDKTLLKESEIQGKVIIKIPYLGIIFRFARRIVFSILVCIYIILYFAYSKHIRNKRNERRRKLRINPQNSSK